jgi:hypothetical protein
MMVFIADWRSVAGVRARAAAEGGDPMTER